MWGDSEHQRQESSASPVNDLPFPWHLGAFDAHCHCAERPACAANFSTMKVRSIAVMATRAQDQSIAADMASEHGIIGRACLCRSSITVVAGFGRHPWFSHELYDDTIKEPTFQVKIGEDIEEAKRRHYMAILTPSPDDPAFTANLPTPIALSTFINETREKLKQHPFAMVGEIGLDSAFRLPMQWSANAKAQRDSARTPGGRERRPLGPYRIKMTHQQAIFTAQLRLAGEMNRAVSVHGVQAHGVLFDALRSSWSGYERESRAKLNRRLAKGSLENKQMEKLSTEDARGMPFPPHICLHSFSGKADAVRQYQNPKIPATIFFSFSATNNLRNDAQRVKMDAALKVIPDNRVLVESDLHEAGDRLDREIEEMYRHVCKVKHWTLEDGVKRIALNYEEFVFGPKIDS